MITKRQHEGDKMTLKVGIREIARNSNILLEHDYIDVEDKKTHEYKGVFVSVIYSDEIKVFLDRKITAKNKLDAMMRFAGFAEGEFGERSVQVLTALKHKQSDEK